MSDFPHKKASLWRRLGAILYDALLLIAVWFVASGLILLVNQGVPVAAGNPSVNTFYFILTFLFFAWFWTHGGQTLGMRAWRIKLVAESQQTLSWMQALLRFMTGLPAWLVFVVGLLRSTLPAKLALPIDELFNIISPSQVLIVGMLWILYDNCAWNWRDPFSKTRVIFLGRNSARLPEQD